MMQEVKLITFKTNHTIIGKVEINKEQGFVSVKQPVQVIVVPPKSASDQGGIAFSPYLEFSQEFTSGIQISADDVLILSTPVIELENQYNQVFGSGIQIASTLPGK
jgi:hypothetical protein